MDDRPGKSWVVDSFTNFAAKTGIGTDNQASAGSYSYSFLTRNRTLLEAAYRTSWIVGAAVDAPADDMTREGVEIDSTMEPDDVEAIQAAMSDLMIWQGMGDAVRWGRLFGGGLGVLLIDGQDMATPLRVDSVGRGQFRGLMVLDRWLVQPSDALITDLGPNMGLPVWYDVVGSNPDLVAGRIHHSRCIRLTGIDLPYYQRQYEQHWGESVIERIYDRLIAFDSTTQGAAQLVYKAHLRTLKVEKLRELIAAGGKVLEAFTQQVDMIRRFQNNEGLTLLDASDDMAALTYSFTGLDDILLQFGQQLSGALEIPLVRLFGQSPSGFNSSGESDLRTYYDGITKKQERHLRRPVTLLLDVLCRSILGRAAPPGFRFHFKPLWQTSDSDKADIATKVTSAVVQAHDAGLVSQRTALTELRGSAKASGLWSNITDEDMDEADDAPPTASELEPVGTGEDAQGDPLKEQEPLANAGA